MSDTLEWLEKTQGTPELKEPSKLSWERGPINPDTQASHTYVISGLNMSTNPEAPEGLGNELTIYFQNGIVPEVGLNGVTPEILLEILVDRFKLFQKGNFACPENEKAIVGMEQAIDAIRSRIKERLSRGVLNTLEK